MTFEQQLKLLQKQFDVVEVINLDQWHDYSYEAAQSWLESELARVYRPVYDHNQRIVFVQQQGDVYVKDNSVGLIIRNLQIIANEKDVSNFFIVLLSNNPNITKELEFINSISQDPVPITGIHIDEGDFTATIVDTHPTSLKEIYQYGSANPLKINLKRHYIWQRTLIKNNFVYSLWIVIFSFTKRLR
jgi:virulence-associated protein VapD